MDNLDYYMDLHLHTYWSFDGFISPHDVLSNTQLMGAKLIAVTEHDNMDSWGEISYLRSAFDSLSIVPGVELSSTWQDYTIGVLGVGFDPNDKLLRSFLSSTAQHDVDFLHRWYIESYKMGLGDVQSMVENWITETFPDFPERLNRYVPEWILTRLLLENGIVSDMEMAKEVNKLIVTKAMHPQLPEVTTAIRLIQKAGGIAILEHPSQDLTIQAIKNLMREGFDGIELYHGGVSLDSQQKLLDISREKGWLISAGSDGHGVRSGWGREGQLEPHPKQVYEDMVNAISQTAFGNLP